MARVAVIGPVTAENLFAADEPVDSIIKLNGINFRVVGVLKSKGDQGWFNPDDQVIMPYTTAMKQLFGQDYLREVDVQADSEEDLDPVEEAVTRCCVANTGCRPARTTTSTSATRPRSSRRPRTSHAPSRSCLGSIASISLIVGGIGIMNIMLVTVTERTREIGVRKAIGAKRRDILQPFLIEALLMSALGGLIGVLRGMGAASAVGSFTRFTTQVELRSVLLSLTFSGGIGVFFGWYPARRAAMLEPIEALRYE